jgi:hypothetical protein
VPLAHVEKIGVWLNGEGLLFQAVKGFIQVIKPRILLGRLRSRTAQNASTVQQTSCLNCRCC